MDKHIEKAIIVEGSGCASCNVGFACLLDGIIPDLEVLGLWNLFGVAD
jgi:hypothetical protein